MDPPRVSQSLPTQWISYKFLLDFLKASYRFVKVFRRRPNGSLRISLEFLADLLEIRDGSLGDHRDT